MSFLEHVGLVAIGGMIGSIARYSITCLIADSLVVFPVATLLVNVVGCFMIGLVYEWLHHHTWYPLLHLIFCVGFLGAFTTFSTLSFETLKFIHQQAWLLAILNAVGTLILGLVAVALGSLTGHALSLAGR